MAENKDKRTIEIIVNGQQANASLKEMNAAAAVLYAQFQKMSKDDPGRAKVIADYQALKGKIADVKTELTGVSQNAGLMKQAFTNAFAFVTAGGITGLIGQVVDLGKSVFETTAKFQTYESVMTNALGDKSKAQKAMADIQQMAAKTPFSVDELTGSFIKFVNRGLQPSMAEMTKMADIAASQGKSFDQLTEAVLDAAGGEFERLKEFGIKASKSGDQVSLSFKGITQSVKNTPEAINGAIMAFGGMKGIAGSTAAISATLEGQLSNLGDTSDQLKIKVGEGLKPAFTLILGLFGRILDWIGRFVEQASPLKELFVEIGAIVSDFYHEIGDVLESLGLFSEKTDTVKMAVEALKFILTLVLIPIRSLYLAAKGMVDVFIDWYNKSEMLRGILGGLGAMVVSVFTTIKEDALKILGGVGDILIGIFSLDKDKIIAGFKSALAGTADLALESGQKAADAFLKGYEANKDNHITRTLRVKTSETSEGSSGQAGETLKSDADPADAAAAKKREAAAKKAAAALEKQHKAEELAERHHQEMLLNLEEAALIARGDKREIEYEKIMLDAKRDALAVTGTEAEKQAAIALIMAEAHQKQAEKREEFAKEDRKQQEEFVDQQLEDIDEDEARKQAAFQVAFDAGLMSQKAYNDSRYEARKAALERELALIEGSLGKESKAYKKVYGELLKLTVDHNQDNVADAKKTEQAKWEIAQLSMKTAGDVVQTTIDLLFKDEAARQKHHNVYTALAGAKIIIDGAKEVAAIWQYSAEQPENSVTAGVFGTVLAGIQTGLAVARTAFALTQLQEFSFAKGGRTGGGQGLAGSPLGELLQYSGMSVGSNGKLTDESGFAVAGVVHEDEYVIPAWLRQDPQVAAFENWVEAKRLRGYYEGGATGGAAARPSVDDVFNKLGSDGASTTELLGAMLGELRTMNGRLAGVENWQSRFEVVLDVNGHQRLADERKQVKLENGIRA